MKLKSQIALAALALSAGSAAMAELSYNIGAVSEYRYRGISQTRFEPTVQGGIDYAHAGGFYLGAWGSGIKWIKDAGASRGDIELDLYGGYKGSITKDLGFDVGYLRYEYVDNKLKDVTGVDASTDEIYGALSYGPVTAKLSYSLSDLFGTPNSKGSTYFDLSATFDLGGGYALAPHLGSQTVANNSNASYNDWSLALVKDFGNGLSASLAAVGTDAKNGAYVSPDGYQLGRSTVVLGVKYAF
jgi:uncharacterized protein (TIGR02001 family)